MAQFADLPIGWIASGSTKTAKPGIAGVAASLLPRRGDGRVRLIRTTKRVGDEPVGLQLLDEVPQEPDGFGPAGPGRADRLLDLHEPVLDQPDVGMAADELGHRLPDPGGDLEALVAELVDALLAAHDGGVLSVRERNRS